MHANKPYIVGLTGGIGCGKSEAAACLRALGAAHVDADAISHALTAEGGAALPAIRARFGEPVFHTDGTLDRAALSEIVFGSEQERRALEGILHPLIQSCMLEAIQEAGDRGEKVVILDVPLLFETGIDVLCDETWVVSANEETQLARVMARDQLTAEQAQKRIASQMSTEDRVARATRVISTDRSIERTKGELTNLYNQLVKRID